MKRSLVQMISTDTLMKTLEYALKQKSTVEETAGISRIFKIHDAEQVQGDLIYEFPEFRNEPLQNHRC